MFPRFTIPIASFTLEAILATLNPVERRFFDDIDIELNKVENFYIEREKEAIIFSSILKEQLQELEDHRRIFHVCRSL
jgi:hypothetical protein